MVWRERDGAEDVSAGLEATNFGVGYAEQLELNQGKRAKRSVKSVVCSKELLAAAQLPDGVQPE